GGVARARGDARPRGADGVVMRKAQPDPRAWGDRRAGGTGEARRCAVVVARASQADFMLPPWILLQSPAGSSTKEPGSRACVAWPAQECAPSAQSFLPAALMP